MSNKLNCRQLEEKGVRGRRMVPRGGGPPRGREWGGVGRPSAQCGSGLVGTRWSASRSACSRVLAELKDLERGARPRTAQASTGLPRHSLNGTQSPPTAATWRPPRALTVTSTVLAFKVKVLLREQVTARFRDRGGSSRAPSLQGIICSRDEHRDIFRDALCHELCAPRRCGQ